MNKVAIGSVVLTNREHISGRYPDKRSWRKR